MPASGAQPAGFSLAPPRKRAPSMASHRSKMSQGGQSTYSTASVRDKDRDVRGPSIDSAGDSDDGDTVLFRADAELPPVLDAIPPARPITMGFLQPISHGADADSEEGSDDESDSEEDALLQPEVPGWAHETIGRLDISEAGESTLKPAAEPPWVAHAPPRSDSRESPPSSPPPSEAPTPPPKFAPSVSTEVTDHVSAGSTVAEPTARHQPSSLSLSSMTSYEPPSPSRASPSRSDLAPTPQTSKRALLSSIQSAASKGLKIAKEKSTELGMAAREYAIQTVEAAQEQWERQREKRLAAGPDAETASMRSGSSSWFKSTPTTVFNVLLTQSCRHFGLPFPAPATLPALIVRCLQVLDRPSVLRDSVGLYRLSASRKDLDRVRAQIESDPRCDVDFGWPNEDEPEIQAEEGVEWSTISLHAQRLEINIVAGILKLFLREAPDASIPYPLATKLDALDLTSLAASSLLRTTLLPPLSEYHISLYSSLFRHLKRVAMHSEENKMNAANLAIVFAPSLGLNVAVVEVLIERAEEVWPRESGWGWEQLKAVPRYQPLSPKKDRKEDRERPELPPRPSNASEGDRRPPRPPKPVSLSSNNPFAMFSRNAGSLRKTENPFATMRKEISGPKDPIKIGENPFATIKKEREREEDGGEGMEWTRLTGNENGWES